MPDIKLTLGEEPILQEVEAQIEPLVMTTAEEVKPVFTLEEQKTIDDFAKTIDIGDSKLVLSYGANAQQRIAQFADGALINVKSKDLGEVGDLISGLVVELKGFTDEQEQKGLFGFLKKQGNKLELMKARFDAAEINVNKIVNGLESHQVQLLKDVATLDQLYQMNLTYFKELSMYIEAGKKRLHEVRETELKELRQRAEQSHLPEDAQAANDFANKCERFEKKIYDLELTRNISIQMAPQIRMIQGNDQLMAEKIQTSLVNTIPLWKNQMVLAMGLQHSMKAMEAQRAVTDITNQMLRKNAEMLKTSTLETAKEAERGIVDIETLTFTNQTLIDTMDEVLQIQRDGRLKRIEAEKELHNIEDQLKKKLLEMNQ